MTRTSTAIAFIFMYFLLAVVYLTRTSAQLEGTLFLIPSLLATCLGIYAASTYKLDNIHGKAMAFLAAGMAFFFVGEAFFYLYQFVIEKTPFPSVADIFYLTAYPLLLLGLLIEVRIHKPKLSEFSKSAIATMATFLLVAIALVSYFGIYKAYDADASGLANFIGISYGIADLVILVPAMYVLKLAFDFKGGKLFNSWMMIFFAIIFMLVADILFASYSDQYSSGAWPYNLIDLAWTASYLLFGFSFYYTASVLIELRTKLQNTKPAKKH